MMSPFKTNEEAEQAMVFEWATYHLQLYPDLALLHHVPNGGYRAARTAARLKQQGVKAGVPDLVLPVARGGLHGLYVELKVGKNQPTLDQLWWLEQLAQRGYAAGVAWGWEAATDVLRGYLDEVTVLPDGVPFAARRGHVETLRTDRRKGDL